MSRATISTHVLDVSLGKPVPDVGVTLLDPEGNPAGQGRTDRDGRLPALAAEGVAPGVYRLVFEVEDYFADRPHLFNAVTLDIEIAEARHYHVPLLVAPFACSSYRGT